MFKTLSKTVKRLAIPILLTASLFACCTSRYETLLASLICIGATIGVLRAVWLRQFFWAAGLVATIVVFMPLPLATKAFLLMGFICIATFLNLVKAFRTQPVLSRVASAVSMLALAVSIPASGTAQTTEPLDVKGKLEFHAERIYGPGAILSDAAYAAFLQETNSPAEWGQGGAAYGKRLASASGASAIHGVLAFGLDSALHQDPRYYRSHSSGFWRRSGHALRGTLLTRTDAGGEALSAWRIGSAYGTAFLSNLWYPDRLDTVQRGFSQGSVRLAFDLASNLGSEFWPDIKAKIFRRKMGP